MSGSVFLNNLDDFIVPSQACVNPFVASKLNNNAAAVEDAQRRKANVANSSVGIIRTNKKHGRVTLQTDFSKSDFDEAPVFTSPSTNFSSSSGITPSVAALAEPDLIKTKASSDSATKKAVATVSLNDCLACSGCVTSAEAILIQEQSNDKLIRLLEEKDENTIVVVVMSPNSRSSLADFLEMNNVDFFLRLSAILKQLGVTYVLDAAAGNDVALIESREEFLYRFKNGRSREWVKPETTTANSATSINILDNGNIIDVPLVSLQSHLPVLTSHCPGWVCYAEKTSPQSIPYMSTVKSAQQIVGTIVKNLILTSSNSSINPCSSSNNGASDTCSGGGDGADVLSLALNNLSVDDLNLDNRIGCCGGHGDQDKVKHKNKRVIVVSVQPCFDKKLEASRRDFYHAEKDVNEVDFVLSTTELWQLIEMYAWKWVRVHEGEEEYAPKSQEAVITKPDFDAPSSGSKKIRRNTDAEPYDPRHHMDVADDERPNSVNSPNRDSVLVRNRSGSCREMNFKHIFDYLHSIEPDEINGSDEIERLFRCFSEVGSFILHAAERNAGSGAYTEYLFKYCAQHVYGLNLWSEVLQYKEGRNSDYAEVDITHYLNSPINENAVLPQLKFAKAYGFRNIQSMLMKMKRGNCDVDLVEIMACPSGCNNGGGQLKALSSMISIGTNAAPTAPPRTETVNESKERISNVEKLYHDALQFRHPDDNPLVSYLYDSKRLGKPLSDAARKILHTRYHAVPKLETIAPLAAKW